METAVQLAQEDGEEAVSSQAGHVPRALVVDHHILVVLRLHLKGATKNRHQRNGLSTEDDAAHTTMGNTAEFSGYTSRKFQLHTISTSWF